MATKTPEVDEVEAAQLAHEREVKRFNEANDEIARLSDEVRESDPDDQRAFTALVARREAARARVEALSVRVERSAAAFEQARARAAQAEREERRRQVEDLEAQIHAADAAITAACSTFHAELVARIAKLRQLTDQVGQLDPKPWAASPRGTRWAGVSAGEAMLVAAGTVGATAAGASRVLL